MARPGDSFTTADILSAVAALRANRVPPAKCSACGAEVYLMSRSGLKNEKHWKCDCGVENAAPTITTGAGWLPVSARTES